MKHIDVTPLNHALGAEIDGVDLSRPIAAGVLAELHQAFLQYLVLFFRTQTLTPQQQLAAAACFGRPMAYPQLKGIPDCPLVTPVIKLEHETINFGGVWHSDTAYLERPPMASMLYALQTPRSGGDTLFANQHLAYEDLSDAIKEKIASLRGVNSSMKADASRTREDRQRESGDEQKALVASHPVVRTHPETGRKSLYVNVGHTTHFDGWTEADSAPLLQQLFAHQTRPEYLCRFHWEPGSVALWDNRCTLHYPMNDYHGQRRVMHRVTLEGEKPF